MAEYLLSARACALLLSGVAGYGLASLASGTREIAFEGLFLSSDDGHAVIRHAVAFGCVASGSSLACAVVHVTIRRWHPLIILVGALAVPCVAAMMCSVLLMSAGVVSGYRVGAGTPIMLGDAAWTALIVAPAWVLMAPYWVYSIGGLISLLLLRNVWPREACDSPSIELPPEN